MPMVGPAPEPRWLLLIHQIPPKPAYLRVKIWRRLQAMGAVAVKSSVYVTPRTDESQEDLEWILREIVKGGGDATICEARFIEGLEDDQIEALFNAARESDYRQIADEARAIVERGLSGDGHPDGEVARLRRRLVAVTAIDFFGAPGRESAAGMVDDLERRPHARDRAARGVTPAGELRGRTWVTRKGVHIDRIASAWLIRRFVDEAARFKFVAARGYHPEPGEVRFDMFEAEYTHDGDECTFEVLLTRLGLDDAALRPIAEIVHDVDLKDGKFGRPEVAGIEPVIVGIAVAYRDDGERLARGGAVFDALYESFRRKRR